jgi:hypothetical protein
MGKTTKLSFMASFPIILQNNCRVKTIFALIADLTSTSEQKKSVNHLIDRFLVYSPKGVDFE